MDWFRRKWMIDDEEGELEFLKALFDTEDIESFDEDVSSFQVINVAGMLYAYFYYGKGGL